MTVDQLFGRVRAILATIPQPERAAVTDTVSLACLLAENQQWSAAHAELCRAARVAPRAARPAWDQLATDVFRMRSPATARPIAHRLPLSG